MANSIRISFITGPLIGVGEMGKNQLKFLPILPRMPIGDATQFVVLSRYDKLNGA